MFPFPWPSQKNAGNSAIVEFGKVPPAEFRTIRLLSPDGKLTCESLQTFPRPMPRSLLLSARLDATRFELPASEIPFAEFHQRRFLELCWSWRRRQALIPGSKIGCSR